MMYAQKQMIKTEHGAYITHNATYPLSDITGGSLRELPLEQQYEVVLPKTCKHTLM